MAPAPSTGESQAGLAKPRAGLDLPRGHTSHRLRPADEPPRESGDPREVLTPILLGLNETLVSTTPIAYQRCISRKCGATYDIREVRVACERCGDLLDVAYDWDRARPPRQLADFESLWARRREPACYSGVWRFHRLLPFCPPDQIVTVGEGQTLFQQADAVARYVDVLPGHLFLQYEGMNPSGSFKDNGMTAAFTHARMVNAQRAACASGVPTGSKMIPSGRESAPLCSSRNTSWLWMMASSSMRTTFRFTPRRCAVSCAVRACAAW